MSQHPNARLTPRGRELLVDRVRSGATVAETSRMAGVSRQTGSKWRRRALGGEPLADRGCRPRRLARKTPPEVEERVVVARREHALAPLGLSAVTGVPARTCARRRPQRHAAPGRLRPRHRGGLRAAPSRAAGTSASALASSCTST